MDRARQGNHDVTEALAIFDSLTAAQQEEALRRLREMAEED